MMSGEKGSRKKSEESNRKREFREKFAVKLRHARENAGLSQDAVANKLGVNTQTIVNYEGRRSLPDAFTLSKLSECLQADLNTLLDPSVQRPGARRHPLELGIDLLSSARDLGLIGLYRSRLVALRPYAEHLRSESSFIRIVGSSIRGLLQAIPGVIEILEDRHNKEVDIQVVLSSPLFSFLREPIEGRRQGGIWDEIEEAWTLLTSTSGTGAGLGNEQVRFFPGAPTVFLLATSSRMVLNPYPYGSEAYRTLCLEVEPGPSADNIYEAYMREHFEKAWRNSVVGEEGFFKGVADEWIEEGRKILTEQTSAAPTPLNLPRRGNR